MKKHDGYLATSRWYRDIITDPYQVIAEFFSGAHVGFYRKLIKGVLLSNQGEHIFRKEAPGNLLYHFKMLEAVVNAAWLINKEKRKSPFQIDSSGLLDKNLYCGSHFGCCEWHYFPRALSLREYKNPFLVFKSFFKYREIRDWKAILQEVLDYALITGRARADLDTLSIYFHLIKLVEAAHLIDVREITHVGGMIKNRF